MIENAKGFANTRDFFNKVNEKTGKDYWYFAEQYFYSPNQPELEYYQTNSQFFYKWSNVNDNFIMPLDLLVNGEEVRILPSKNYQSFKIKKYSQIEVMDWKFFVMPKEKE
jgi:aminopeptidase N